MKGLNDLSACLYIPLGHNICFSELLPVLVPRVSPNKADERGGGGGGLRHFFFRSVTSVESRACLKRGGNPTHFWVPKFMFCQCYFFI